MSGTKILIVDDEQRMRKLVRDYLIREGYSVLEAADGRSALDQFYNDGNISLIILDVMMPEMDGWQVCAEIRKTSKVPIIMLTAKSDERDELRGFDLGAAQKHLEAGGIEIDKAAHIVTIDKKPVELSFKEFELLQYFMENNGIALSRERILNSVWNYDYYGDARTIDTHVKKLRSKLGDKASLIKTVWGIGYKFEA